MIFIAKWEFDWVSEQLESFHGVRDIHLGVSIGISAPAGYAKVELFLERLCAINVDAAAVVGVEELVDGRVTVLRDRREMRLLLQRYI